MPKCDKYHAKWKANMAKCSKYHAKCKVTMPKCSKIHANTMQNDRFYYSSKLLQIQGKWYQEGKPKQIPKTEAKKTPKTILHPLHIMMHDIYTDIIRYIL